MGQVKDRIVAWLDWIADPAMQQVFIDEALRTMHGAVSMCKWCQEYIALDAGQGTGGVFNWHIEGDYGCDAHPDNDEEGCGGHEPIQAVHDNPRIQQHRP